jgi:hypothetical protein
MAGKLIKRSDKDKPELSGQGLVADFLGAMTNLTTAQTAAFVAKQSETQTLATIEAANPQYVTPRDLTPEAQDRLVRSSLNAHLQKVQAEQLDAMTEQQLQAAEAAAREQYLGKKLTITVLDPEFEPIESYWFDSKTGEERRGILKTKTIKGSIHDLSLRKNVLMIKPTLVARTILPERKFLFVYVINPNTLQPAVSVSFS